MSHLRSQGDDQQTEAGCTTKDLRIKALEEEIRELRRLLAESTREREMLLERLLQSGG